MAARARISGVKNFILPVGFVGVEGQRWIDTDTLKETTGRRSENGRKGGGW